MESTISFRLELYCSQTSKSRQETISFPEDAPPLSAVRIKEKIEEEFSIPICVQSMRYEGHLLSDDTSLEMMKIRPGDAFHVTYLSEGDCKEIKRAVQWFIRIKDGLVAETPSKMKPMSRELEDSIKFGFNEQLVDNLAFEHLFPWQDPRKYTNRLYVVQCGGLKAIMEIYASLHQNSWSNFLMFQKYLEDRILSVLWNLAETLELRRSIVSHNDGLSLCIKSLMRQTLDKGKPIVDTTSVDHRSTFILQSTITNALGLLWK